MKPHPNELSSYLYPSFSPYSSPHFFFPSPFVFLFFSCSFCSTPRGLQISVQLYGKTIHYFLDEISLGVRDCINIFSSVALYSQMKGCSPLCSMVKDWPQASLTIQNGCIDVQLLGRGTVVIILSSDA